MVVELYFKEHVFRALYGKVLIIYTVYILCIMEPCFIALD